MVDAARHRDQQLAAGAALHGNADVRPAVGVRAVEHEVLAVRVVEVLRRHRARVRDPVAVLVVDVQRVDLRQLGRLRGQHPAQPLDLGRARAVVLDALDHADQHRVGLLDRVVGLLRQRARQVRRRHAHLLEQRRARLPAVPDVERHERDAHGGHEGHRADGNGKTLEHGNLGGSECGRILAGIGRFGAPAGARVRQRSGSGQGASPAVFTTAAYLPASSAT